MSIKSTRLISVDAHVFPLIAANGRCISWNLWIKGRSVYPSRCSCVSVVRKMARFAHSPLVFLDQSSVVSCVCGNWECERDVEADLDVS